MVEEKQFKGRNSKSKGEEKGKKKTKKSERVSAIEPEVGSDGTCRGSLSLLSQRACGSRPSPSKCVYH